MIRGFVKPVRALFLSGAVLTILGSFLPWGITGGIVRRVIVGIRFWTEYWPYWKPGDDIRMLIVDNGGLLIVLLTGVSVWLAFHAPKLIRHPQAWIVVTAVALVLVTAYHIADWELQILRWGSNFEAPVLREGLQIVLLGSSLLLFVGLRDYRAHGSAAVMQK